MLVATWLTWVTVAMSTKPGDRHHLGGHSVAVFGVWVWVWVRVGVHGLHNALPRMPTVCGWLSPGLVGLAPKLGVNGALWATIVLDILFLVLCQVCTLPWCLPPNRHLILPHERLSACDCYKCGQYRWGFLCERLFMWPRHNFVSDLNRGIFLFVMCVEQFHV